MSNNQNWKSISLTQLIYTIRDGMIPSQIKEEIHKETTYKQKFNQSRTLSWVISSCCLRTNPDACIFHTKTTSSGSVLYRVSPKEPDKHTHLPVITLTYG